MEELRYIVLLHQYPRSKIKVYVHELKIDPFYIMCTHYKSSALFCNLEQINAIRKNFTDINNTFCILQRVMI